MKWENYKLFIVAFQNSFCLKFLKGHVFLRQKYALEKSYKVFNTKLTYKVNILFSFLYIFIQSGVNLRIKKGFTFLFEEDLNYRDALQT